MKKLINKITKEIKETWTQEYKADVVLQKEWDKYNNFDFVKARILTERIYQLQHLANRLQFYKDMMIMELKSSKKDNKSKV